MFFRYTTKVLIGLLLFCVGLEQTLAQNGNPARLHDGNHYWQKRTEIRMGNMGGLHTALQPLSRKDIRAYATETLDSAYWNKDARGRFNYEYILADNNDHDSSLQSKRPFMKFLYPNGDRSFLRHFYKSPAHFLEFRAKDFYVNINPILHLQGMYEQAYGTNNLRFLNRRGASIRGNIAGKVYFYTELVETQADVPKYVGRRIIRDFAVPGAGFFKQYDSNLTPEEDTAGVDYLLGQGYVAIPLFKNYISMRLGHGQHFIGDGHRSLFLSDFSTNYFYLQLDTRIWKIHYQNIFAELTQNYGQRQRAFDLVLPKKYMAAHYLSINILKNLSIGLFENVIFSRNGQFDLQYLNPIILYRTVEQAVGSPDNVVLGLNWKWIFLKRFSFYGQFILDELSVGDLIRLGGSWWGNKFGLQAGLKYVDAFGIDWLDLQAEVNVVRPYTYTFRDSTANYTHYNQALAHPLGANFWEAIFIANYQPMPRMNLRLQVNIARYGQDSLGSNWGSSPHIGYNSRMQELNNTIGQGVTTNLLLAQLHWSYQLRHNLFAELQFTYRQEQAELAAYSNQSWLLGLGLRWNISAMQHDW